MVRKLLGARVLAETSVVIVIIIVVAVVVVVVVIVIIFVADTITSSASVITFKVAVITRTAAVSALVWIISWAARKKIEYKIARINMCSSHDAWHGNYKGESITEREGHR